ncbi:MAG: hypothetical protein ACYC63_12815 [Armatimonadota bacterium]
MRIAIWLSMLLLIITGALAADEVIGKRPYEMDWANRFQDDHSALVDFENLDGWTVKTAKSVASIARTREQQLWDKYVGKFTYRADGDGPTYLIMPPQPIKIAAPFDAVSLWVYGNNWSFAPNVSTPPVSIAAKFVNGQGREVNVPLITVSWQEWHLCTRRLTPEQIALVKDGASFVGIEISNGRNKQDRVLFFDNLAVFTEQFPPLKFEPRRARGIAMFPGQGSGTNTGPGKLPFPNRPETILPDNLVKGFKTSVKQDGKSFVFTYAGSDGTLKYALTPSTGTWSDITARWGNGTSLRPLAGGGVYLVANGKPVAPEKLEALGTKLAGDTVISKWRASAGDVSTEVTYTYRLWNKSLVIDTVAPGGKVAEVRYGVAEGLDNPRLATNPYYHFGGSLGRPAVAVSGPADKALFLTGNTDWYLSNGSVPFSINEIKDGKTSYQGGTRYTNKTDGTRNDVYERFFVTMSPRYEEVLPTVPNPKSPHMAVAGTHVWKAHGAGNRENDAAHWTNIWRHGMRECVITDHETGWRDGGESFTFRTRPAPGKGGDKGQYDYARLMQDKLGFVYGPYNNYTDFAPVNEFWSFDLISRTPDNQLQGAWMRCYAPKPSRAVEYCAKLAPIIQEKFKFSTAYCDVHTAVAPWDRVDYDHRVPGAGTFAATFYSYGEIMMHQKEAWQGPVYSEGNHHFWYSGLTDGNYAQDRGYDIPNNPWLVDLDLRKMHDLDCNFGMGAESMFYGEKTGPGDGPDAANAYTDRFLAATVAFGHPGYLCSGGFDKALRGYYMIQQLAANYTLSPVKSIRYMDESGKLLDTSAAVASGAYKRNQIVTEYANGTVTVVNGNKTERMKYQTLELPPNGYAGWTKDRSVEAYSGDAGQARYDYCKSPAYTYIDGRGKFTRLADAASDGIGVCRTAGKNQWEIIPYKGANCGFKLPAAKAVALVKDCKEIGPAELRVSRGLTYVVPVEGAFSYMLTATGGATQALASTVKPRTAVIAGEAVPVKLRTEHVVQIPADAKPGQRIWQQLEGQWFDFTVVPLAEVEPVLAGNTLKVSLRSNLAQAEKYRVEVLGQSKEVTLTPGKAAEVSFELGAPAEESAELLAITLTAGKLTQKTERGLRTISAPLALLPLPAHYDTGMCVRGGSETSNFGETSGHVIGRSVASGDVTHEAIFMHPPWMAGTGYCFALYDAVTLPKDQPAAFRALVGKADGSYLGDGILYKVAVVDAAGKQTIVAEKTVLEHAWVPIEADLSQWAGQKVRIQMISDVGKDDNSSGDWACWSKMSLQSLKPVLQRTLEPGGEAYRREPAPMPLVGVTVDDLRKAKSGRLHYDGIGFSGGGEYGCYAILNGVNMGFMSPAGGDEGNNVWAADVTMPLTPEAIAKLGRRNVFSVSDPNKDYFKIRRFWIDLELADGRKISSDIAGATYTQPPGWPHAEGILVPHGKDITVDLWFEVKN